MKFTTLAMAILAGLAMAAPVKVLHLGMVGNPYDTPIATGILGYAQEHKLFETEFAKDGIEVKWVFYKGTGPAINEGLASGAVDITSYGDLPGIIGKSGGIDTKLVVPGTVGQNIYIAVAPNSPLRTLQDLKGKRIGYLKGTYLHLAWVRLVRRLGFSEKDFKIFNLSQTEGVAALQGGHIDAYVGVNTFQEMAERGAARILYTSNTKDALAREIQGFSVVVASTRFATEHPEIVQRWVDVYVRASVALLREDKRDEWIRLGAKPGYSPENVRKDLGENRLDQQNAPVFDQRYTAKLRSSIQAARDAGLVRRDIDVDRWIDRRFLDNSLKNEASKAGWVGGFGVDGSNP